MSNRNFTLIGRPGSGKGTQGKMLASVWNIPHISTGDMLRIASKLENDLGKKVATVMGTGELVPDEIVIALLKERLYCPDTRDGFILDGYPRTIEQAITLSKLLDELKHKPVRAIEIEVTRAQVIKRLLGRYNCSKCGKIYQIKLSPPRLKNICDICNIHLVQRADDRSEVIIRRQDFYEKETSRLISFYGERQMLFTIDGSDTPENVLMRIKDRLI